MRGAAPPRSAPYGDTKAKETPVAFEVIPAIDLRGGKCVRLFQGDFARETVYGDDPAAMARRWRGEGAGRLHVVDLDGARTGVQTNLLAVRAIAEAAGIPVQAGGGARSLEAVAALIDAGASRVVIGTAAVEDEGFVAEAVGRYGEAIVIGVDARDGKAATEGWERQQSVAAADLIARMRALGAARFVYTDIARDGALTGPNVEALGSAIEAAAPAPVIASGGVATAEHVAALAKTGAEGVIIGRALYTGDLSLGDALAAASG